MNGNVPTGHNPVRHLVIFIDTGAFVARYIERAQYYDVAAEHWGTMRSDG